MPPGNQCSQLNEVNNQPVLKDEIIIIHNGIIVNADELWALHTGLKRAYSIDTEIIPVLLRKELQKSTDLAVPATGIQPAGRLPDRYAMNVIRIMDQFVLATNNGSLYYITDKQVF
jgi:glucosamine 6-phosphate synthetase-like amidotransferase/phosphosugar isomerase protein